MVDLYEKDDYDRSQNGWIANMWHDFKDERGKAIATTERQKKMNETDQKFKVRIRQGDISVWQPLPDEFGFTISNTFEQPFDSLAFGSAVSKYNMVNSVAKTGLHRLTANPGLAMKKAFLGPEPSEISLELEFVAHYNAIDEVIIPVLKILRMGAVNEMDFAETWNDIKKVIGSLQDSVPLLHQFLPKNIETEQAENTGVELGDKAQSYIQFLESPKTVDIYYGNLYVMKNVFIQSYAISFSNNVDVLGVPLSATLSLTFALQDVPTRERVLDWFDSQRVSRTVGGVFR